MISSLDLPHPPRVRRLRDLLVFPRFHPRRGGCLGGGLLGVDSMERIIEEGKLEFLGLWGDSELTTRNRMMSAPEFWGLFYMGVRPNIGH